MAIVKTIIGNVRGPKGDIGEPGPQGVPGIPGGNGIRGSRWVTGIGITGTSTEESIFPDSGIEDALINDQYLNSETGHVYRCTEAGNTETAKWVWTATIKGPTGPGGELGSVVINNDSLFKWNDAAIINDGSDNDDFRQVSEDGRLAITMSKKYYSTDRKTWNMIDEDQPVYNVCVSYGNGRYIVCQFESESSVNVSSVNVSSDGINWNVVSEVPFDSSLLNGIKYLGGKFIAYKHNNIYTSIDGETWNTIDVSGRLIQTMAHMGYVYLAIGYDSALISTDGGVTWNSSTPIPNTDQDLQIFDAVGGQNAFMILTNKGLYSAAFRNGNLVWASPKSIDVNGDYGSIIYDSIRKITTIASGAEVWTSGPNDNEWSLRKDFKNIEIKDLSYVDGTTIAIHNDGIKYAENTFEQTVGDSIKDLYTIPGPMGPRGPKGDIGPKGDPGDIGTVTVKKNNNNFEYWKNATTTDDSFMGSIKGLSPDAHIAFSQYNGAWYSVDYKTWTKITNFPIDTLKPTVIGYGGGRWLACGQIGGNAGTSYSTDGRNWSTPINKSGGYIYCVAYGCDKFVVGGSGSGTYYSTNGSSWTSGGTISGANNIYGMASNGSRLVAVCNSGISAYSTNGTSWTLGTKLPSAASFENVTYGNGKFVATATDGVYTSSDGASWTKSAGIDGTYLGITGLTYVSGSTFIVIMDDDVWVSKDNGSSWSKTLDDSDSNIYLKCVQYGYKVVVGTGMNSVYYAEIGDFNVDITVSDALKELYGYHF